MKLKIKGIDFEKIKTPFNADIIKTWIWTDKGLFLLDQRKLPFEEKYVLCDNVYKIRKAIKEMIVRGAPAIGICAAIGFAIEFQNFIKTLRQQKVVVQKVKEQVGKISNLLATARPTAINLNWAITRMKKLCDNFIDSYSHDISREELQTLSELLEKEALKIWEEDIEANLRIAELGKDLIPDAGLLTYCNTGALATGGYGTALGIIRKAFETKKHILVYVSETRPFLQGSRLTAWELNKLKIPYRIITDNCAGFLMKKKEINAVIVGADRIAANGDTANKIGTYTLAILAKSHNIPFFVVAPTSSFDLEITSGEKIPIEKRPQKEVLFCGKFRVAPQKAEAYNLAFDITPGELITAIITEKGIIYPPYSVNISQIMLKD